MTAAEFDTEIHAIADRYVAEANALAKNLMRWTQELTAKALAEGVDAIDIARSVDVAMTKVDEAKLLG
ncbi:hypothetical protein [Mesorhizobium sp.]|uniref:hypothetical protein n=1 Tax=Mesorhizobium sp. TaxID=1871066 RepID=UPI000FE2CC60|nr:hypothetical protein [Mesorhizobium sp.]RWJ03493.1 MAG: hypothetical protein EOR24_32450 [Mesorhizobium sp.]